MEPRAQFPMRNKGFTLVEVIMVSFMLSLVMAAVYSLYGTSQKAASMEDEVVDVQQNLRIAMDSLTRDIRLAGFLSSRSRDIRLSLTGGIPIDDIALNGNRFQPVMTAADNSANTAGLPLTSDVFTDQPARVHADLLGLNFASPFNAFAKIAVSQTGVASPFIVRTPESVDLFSVNDRVRIINPNLHQQTTNLRTIPTGTLGTVFRVAAVDRTVPSITLMLDPAVPSIDPSTTVFYVGDMIVRVSLISLQVYPNWVTYCLGPAVNCPVTDAANSCTRQGARDQTLCLVRTENGTSNVLASRISGLQFTYLLDNGTEALNPATIADLGAIRAVRVAITGRTATAAVVASSLTSTEKTRTMASLVALKNRFIIR
jgi:prepilin-type N-terminal cleavage/methylation domain-containing protein